MMRQVKLALRNWLRRRGLHAYADGSLPPGVDWLLDVRKHAPPWSSLTPGAPPIFFDVGANIGQTTLEMREYFPEARIFAFEPFAAPYRALQEVASRLPGATACPVALGARAETLQISAHPSSVLSSLTPAAGQATGPVETVTVVTLDQFCAEEKLPSIQVLKTDTEGHDLAVLQGGGGLLAAGRIQFIYTEVTFNRDNRQNSPFEPIYELLAGFGYRFLGLYEQYPMHHYPAPLHFCNALFMHPAAPAPPPPAVVR